MPESKKSSTLGYMQKYNLKLITLASALLAGCMYNVHLEADFQSKEGDQTEWQDF